MSGHFGTLCIKGLKFCYLSLKPLFSLFAAKKHELHAKEEKNAARMLQRKIQCEMFSQKFDKWQLCRYIQKQPPEVFCKKGVLKHFAKFLGKHLCQSLFLNKVACFRAATLLKKRLWRRCFYVNFVKFLRTPFLQNTSGQLAFGQLRRNF